MLWRRKQQAQNTFFSTSWTTLAQAGMIGPTGATGLAGATPELKDSGLAIEPIVALREFRVAEGDGIWLCSFNWTAWPKRAPLYAYCGGDIFASHEVPDPSCSCGIYAWKRELTENLHGPLFGEVYLWGDVLIAEDGYRAEVAYPKSLTIRSRPTRTALRIRDGLERAYGVPVALIDPVPDTGLTAAMAATNLTVWKTTS